MLPVRKHTVSYIIQLFLLRCDLIMQHSTIFLVQLIRQIGNKSFAASFFGIRAL